MIIAGIILVVNCVFQYLIYCHEETAVWEKKVVNKLVTEWIETSSLDWLITIIGDLQFLAVLKVIALALGKHSTHCLCNHQIQWPALKVFRLRWFNPGYRKFFVSLQQRDISCIYPLAIQGGFVGYTYFIKAFHNNCISRLSPFVRRYYSVLSLATKIYPFCFDEFTLQYKKYLPFLCALNIFFAEDYYGIILFCN